MIKYIHGSEDSVDLDVVYVMDKLPSFKECQSFCSDLIENRNIMTVKNGVVDQVFKGTPDELNNGILTTYPLHDQNHPLIIEHLVERDVLIKYIRGLRCILSHCSRTKYRKEVKTALKSYSLNEKILILKNIDFKSLDDYGDKNVNSEIYKIFAFQLGQCLGLSNNVELYTKSGISNTFPELRPFLYRENDINVDDLVNCIKDFTNMLFGLTYRIQDNLSYFPKYDKLINLRTEEYE